MTEREQIIYNTYLKNRDVQKVADMLGVSEKRVRNVVGMAKHELDVLPRIYEEWDSPHPSTYDSSRVLVLSDMHIPYHHKDMYTFLEKVVDTYKPTMVVCVGDELEKSAMSFWEQDPELASPAHELAAARGYIAILEEMFPKMYLLHSNHGSMVYRKAKSAGISRHYLKSYNEWLEVGDGWKWYNELTIQLPNGQRVYFHHGKVSAALRLSQAMGMCAVQGHYHESSGIQYWSNPDELLWGMQVGCLIDKKSLAYQYNNCNLKRPILSIGLIIDSVPHIVPMNL